MKSIQTRRSLILGGVLALAVPLFVQTPAIANDGIETTPLLEREFAENEIPSADLIEEDAAPTTTGQRMKEVFIHGIDGVTLAPGVLPTFEESKTLMKDQFNGRNQDAAKWTWRTIKTAPKKLLQAAGRAKKALQKAYQRPQEIVVKGVEGYSRSIDQSYERARNEKDPLKQRFILLQAKAAACLNVAAKTCVQAPAEGLYNAAKGILILPLNGLWIAVKVSIGATGTLIYNVGNPIAAAAVLATGTAASGASSLAIGAIDVLTPNVDERLNRDSHPQPEEAEAILM